MTWPYQAASRKEQQWFLWVVFSRPSLHAHTLHFHCPAKTLGLGKLWDYAAQAPLSQGPGQWAALAALQQTGRRLRPLSPRQRKYVTPRSPLPTRPQSPPTAPDRFHRSYLFQSPVWPALHLGQLFPRISHNLHASSPDNDLMALLCV